jgi:hypothetical protein
MGISALFLANAALQAVAEIAWSEGYQTQVLIGQVLQNHRPELMLTSFAAVVLLSLLLDLRFGFVVLALSLAAATALYRGAPPMAQEAGTVPKPHPTHELITMLFAGGSIATGLLVFRRRVTALDATGFALCAPMAADIAARLCAFSYPFGRSFIPFWPWSEMILAGAGLLCISCSVLRRSVRAAQPVGNEAL